MTGENWSKNEIKEASFDDGPALKAIKNTFLVDALDRTAGIAKIIAGASLAVGSLGTTLAGFPLGIIGCGLGGIIVSRGIEQAVFKPMSRDK